MRNGSSRMKLGHCETRRYSSGQHQVGFAVGALLGLEFDGQVETAFEDAAHAVQVGLMRRRIVVEREFDLHPERRRPSCRVDHRCERVAVVGPLPGLRKARVGQFFAVDLYRLGREDGREAQFVAAVVGRAAKRTLAGRNAYAHRVALLLFADCCHRVVRLVLLAHAVVLVVAQLPVAARNEGQHQRIARLLEVLYSRRIHRNDRACLGVRGFSASV